MAEKEGSVVVLIPIYKAIPSKHEKLALDRNTRVLSNRKIVGIVPTSLDITYYKQAYPIMQFEHFDDSFFRSIQDYNRLMLSIELYEQFQKWDYLLICQTDVYVFQDCLTEWLINDYDYVGAPWLLKPIYKTLPMRLFHRLLTQLKKNKLGHNERFINKGKVGNGGFSLRKVARFIDFLKQNQEKADYYIAHCEYRRFNEDVFWAIEPKNFKYPSVEEALHFAFDQYPRLCFKANNKQLPMAGHNYNQFFWRRYIKKNPSL